MRTVRKTLLTFVLISLAALFVLPAISFANDTLTLGIFPRRNAKTTIKLFKPMAKYLEKKLGRKINLVTTKDFPSFWKGVEAGQYDIVHFNQYHYLKAKKLFNYEAILKNKELGSDTISGSIIVRKDKGFNSLADLKGKMILFGGGKMAMQSYIAATYLLREAGLKAGDYVEEFAKNPPNAVVAVYRGQADAAGSGDVVLKLPIVAKKINVDEMTYLGKTKPYVHLIWAVKGDMDPVMKKKIVAALSGMQDNAEGKEVLKKAKLNSLNPVTDTEFGQPRKIIKAVTGEDL